MTARERLPPDIDALLDALRAAGLAVGAGEILRLHRAFELAPALGQDTPPGRQLRDLLACALVHDARERELFDQVYTPWAQRWQDWLRRGYAPGASPGGLKRSGSERPPASGDRGRRRARRWPAVAARLLAPAVLALILLPIRPPAAPVPIVAPAGAAIEPGFRRVVLPPPATIDLWIPSFEVVRVPGDAEAVRRPAWPPLTLAAAALLAAAGLARRFRTRSWLPRALAPPKLPGPPRLPLLPAASGGPELLDRDGAQTLIWGVDRHLSESLTNDLDLERTVARTAAAGGVPTLELAPEQRLREVWLWLDGTVDDTAVERWAEEIAASLAQAGLPVRIGGFDGYPQELLWDEGQPFRPLDVEGHRQTALVAVCTDGAILCRQLQDERGKVVAALLRALAAWPRLAFVDFSGDRQLARVLEGFAIPAVAPSDLPFFFGLGSAPAATRRAPDPGELRAWQAVLALGWRPVERATAYRVRRELGLDISPWTLHRLRAGNNGGTPTATRLGGLLAWSADSRIELIGWLAETGAGGAGGIRPGSLLDRGLRFWQGRLKEEAAQRRHRGRRSAWEDRPAERHLAMERAMLRLWREPQAAAAELFELDAGELGQRIRRRLKYFAPRDVPGVRERIPLPWKLAELDGRTRYMLAALGLGGTARGELRWPGRLIAAIGLLAGVAAALVLGSLGPVDPPSAGGEVEVVTIGDPPPAAAHHFDGKTGDGPWTVFAGTPRTLESVVAAAGEQVRITWSRHQQPCIEGGGKAQLRRCGSSPRGATTRDVDRSWPRRSLAWIEAATAGDGARSLAAALIDSGSADLVLLGRDAGGRLPELLGPAASGQSRDQLLWIAEVSTGPHAGVASFEGVWNGLVAEPGELVAPLLTIGGIAPLDDAWGDADWGEFFASATSSAVRLSNCPWQEGVHEATEMPFVRICGGTFRMGSEKEEPITWGRETPAHDVTVGGFWIGQTEVTNAQYRVFKPGHFAGDAGDLPAVDVSWFEARDYCRSLGQSEDWEYDLPTEAEWEYATRAGTTTAWSFGDEESQLGDYAWFGEDFTTSQPHPVGKKNPNPWGLYDVHGNVWEWVLDCWDDEAYEKRARDTPIPDPGLVNDNCHQSDTASGALRVLRGGAFGFGPRGLRSAIRNGLQPELSVQLIGFRCVRRARRQP